MITIIAFILVIFGCLNWLSIGLFQFDMVAGLFGFQANIFSRIIYIIIGTASLWLTYAIIKYKGRLTIKKSLKNEPKIPPNNQNNQNNTQNNNPQNNNVQNNNTNQNVSDNLNQNNNQTINQNNNNQNNNNQSNIVNS